MLSKLNIKGFAAIEGLLIVVIVLIVGGTGFYVYHANKNTNDTFNSAAKDARGAPTFSSKKKATPTSKTNALYLDISQWHVKVQLSKLSEGAYYKVSDADTTNPPTFLEVFSKQADAIVGPKGKSCQGEYIALLMRLPKDDSRWSDPQYVGASIAQKDIGDYRYNIATKKQYGPECFDKGSASNYVTDSATEQKFDSYVQAFVADFQTLQAD